MMPTDLQEASEFSLLTEREVLGSDQLGEAVVRSRTRGIELEKILISEFGVPKHILLNALSEYYRCPSIEYDERLPIPREVLTDLSGEALSAGLWMPVMMDTSGTVTIAARYPDSPEVLAEVRKYVKAEVYEFRVALADDIRWYIQDFLHAKPGCLIGTERTGLAYWRNTMAQWRTRLACYRTDLAKARTGLAFQRWGLGTLALANTLLHTKSTSTSPYLYFSLVTAGAVIFFFGLPSYIRIRRSRMTPPGHHTLVEVTAATLLFLENYHFLEDTGTRLETKGTMLARMGDMLADHCTIFYPSPSSRVRTQLARERNVLAAQRTIAACYRTIYSRARTGLAFMRTGFSFMSIGIGLISYFGLGVLTSFDLYLVFVGILMLADGLLWYLPVRKEQAEIPRSLAYPE
ncbi:MAG: hypothetical protein M0Z67_07620 [Nitrospiraceae bacterium]|nr:hypothetical protein [Nitrospiraceae bacterium]